MERPEGHGHRVAVHRPAAIIKLLKYPRRTVYYITKKKEHKPRIDWTCTPSFVAGLKRPIKANTYIHPPGSVGTTYRRLLNGLCGLRDPVHIPAGLGARPQGQTCAVWLKKNMPNFWDFNTWPFTSPDLNPCDYY
ncbi:Transposable element tcb1 transposase, partial [Caligus rogercresseyi]